MHTLVSFFFGERLQNMPPYKTLHFQEMMFRKKKELLKTLIAFMATVALVEKKIIITMSTVGKVGWYRWHFWRV